MFFERMFSLIGSSLIDLKIKLGNSYWKFMAKFSQWFKESLNTSSQRLWCLHANQSPCSFPHKNGTFNFCDYIINLIFRESLSLNFRVQFDAVLTLIILAVSIQSHVKSRCNSLIFVEVVLKHASQLRLGFGFVIAIPLMLFKFVDSGHNLPAVASATTELKFNHVRCIFVAQNLAGSRWSTWRSPFSSCCQCWRGPQIQARSRENSEEGRRGTGLVKLSLHF